MENSVNRIMVNTIVKKAIRDIKSDPERTIRNLVDMALQFADSRFQQEFYSIAQKLLSNEKSAYYALVKDTITQINEESLLTFGMNLGYNGLYDGAKRIRAAKAEAGHNIPWAISMTIAEKKLYDQHHHAVEQGEQLGIHFWHLFSDHGIYECMTLAEHHPDSSFSIFCDSSEITRSVVDYADNIPNIAIVVSFDKQADVVCDMLRTSGILYGIFCSYSEKNLASIESGELLHEMEQLHPTFSVLKPQFSCRNELRERVYSWVTKARLEQEYCTIIWELYGDTLLVDEIISGNPCLVSFDEYGRLHIDHPSDNHCDENLFRTDLPTILKRAFPKQIGNK